MVVKTEFLFSTRELLIKLNNSTIIIISAWMLKKSMYRKINFHLKEIFHLALPGLYKNQIIFITYF